MNLKFKKAFTLVELIVVITILAILWTIAFISLAEYWAYSRDWVRLSNNKVVESSLAYFNAKEWYYPEPSNSQEVIIDNWWDVNLWNTWTIWDSILPDLKSLSDAPVDPVSWEEISYSVTLDKSEFQILSTLESTSLLSSNLLVPNTYAEGEEDSYVPTLSWNYNWYYLVWSDNIYYTVPSLFSDVNSLTTTTESSFDIDDKTVNFTVKPVINSSWDSFINWEIDTKGEYSEFWESIKDIYSASELFDESLYSDLIWSTTSTELSNIAENILSSAWWGASDYSDFVIWTCVFDESVFWDCIFE